MGISEKAIIADTAVLDYIPQRPPIVMVDEFFGIDGNLSVSALTIKEDNIFCKNGMFSDCGIIEHVAQSAALRVGYIYKSNKQDVPLGYIGSVNNFKVHSLPKIGDKITTHINVLQEVMGITLIEAKTTTTEKIVAECKMKIFIDNK